MTLAAMAAAEVTVGLHVSEHGLDGAAASQRALPGPIQAKRGLRLAMLEAIIRATLADKFPR
jgi:hypothetical protein